MAAFVRTYVFPDLESCRVFVRVLEQAGILRRAWRETTVSVYLERNARAVPDDAAAVLAGEPDGEWREEG